MRSGIWYPVCIPRSNCVYRRTKRKKIPSKYQDHWSQSWAPWYGVACMKKEELEWSGWFRKAGKLDFVDYNVNVRELEARKKYLLEASQKQIGIDFSQAGISREKINRQLNILSVNLWRALRADRQFITWVKRNGNKELQILLPLVKKKAFQVRNFLR